MKKGISPVVSSILLIALVILVGGLVFLWMSHTLEKSEDLTLEKKLCDSSNFVIGDFCYENINVENLETGEFENKVRMEFNGRNEASEPELEGFMVFLDYDGRALSISSLVHSEIEGFGSKRITTDFIEDISEIKQIRLVPKIKENNKIFICEKKEIIVGWGDVEPC